MISFEEYKNRKIYEPIIIEIAELMVEHGVDPETCFTYYFEKNEPELFLYLTEAGFFGRTFGTIGDMFRSAGEATGQWWKRTRDRWAGPHAKIDRIVNQISKLINMMERDEHLKDAEYEGLNIIHLLKDIRDMLEKTSKSIPTLQTRQARHTYEGPPPR